MSDAAASRGLVPDPVRRTLDGFRDEFDLDVHLWMGQGGGRRLHLYPDDARADGGPGEGSIVRTIAPRDGPDMELEIRGASDDATEGLATVLHRTLERLYDFTQEIRFFTYELSERYEEINLLYSISETLGSILRLDDAARVILGEVCDVLGARRGALWTFQEGDDVLQLTASVGEEGLMGPLRIDDPDAVTAQVFREGRSMIVTREGAPTETLQGVDLDEADSFLSVPIRYSPPAGEARTVGVVNLIGRRHGGRFTASDQKLLSAIASQVGAALENNRLIQESLAQERVAREMELAHNLQMKLLPAVEKFEHARVAARVEPAESVGGDFYHLFELPAGRIGVMIGDVSGHGFPAALIMALAISAATIYASGSADPADVLRRLADALEDELESTEMYLTLCYLVIDPGERRLVYSNAGHPHAFVVHGDGATTRLEATDPPVGIAGPGSYSHAETSWDPSSDLLLCFTDGLSDTLTSKGAAGSGEERVLEGAVESRHLSPREIVAHLFALSIDTTPIIPADDRTVILLKT